MTFRVSGPSAKHLRGLESEIGAVLSGRRTFEVAVSQAKAAATGKSVLVHGTDTIQQLLKLACWTNCMSTSRVLLGSGVRLFDHLTGMPAVLGNLAVIQGVGVTHLRYPVHKA